MESIQDPIRIQVPLQVGSELRIKNSGKISLGNERQEPALNARAADAVLLYHLDPRQESTSYICLIRWRTTNIIAPEQSPRNCRMM
jgi:hypothetical protein